MYEANRPRTKAATNNSIFKCTNEKRKTSGQSRNLSSVLGSATTTCVYVCENVCAHASVNVHVCVGQLSVCLSVVRERQNKFRQVAYPIWASRSSTCETMVEKNCLIYRWLSFYGVLWSIGLEKCQGVVQITEGSVDRGRHCSWV